MITKEEIVKKLKALKPEIRSRYKVKEIGLFGSFVREEQGERSDIDLLVDFEEGADLFDWIALAQYLEERLKRKVDLVSTRGLRQELRAHILKEAAML